MVRGLWLLVVWLGLEAACVTIDPYAEVRSTWPPLAPGCGRIVFLGDDYRYLGIANGHWKPRIAVDGVPVVHTPGEGVYYFADAPAGTRVIEVNGLEALRVQVVAGTITFLEMSVGRNESDDEPASVEGRRRLQLREVDAGWAEAELDFMRFVGRTAADDR